MIPLVLLCISGEQSKVQTLSKSFLSLLNQFLSVENVSYDTHLDAELKSLATQLLDNNIIVLLANLASREKSEDLFDDASSLIKKVICIVTGKELRFEMLNSLMHSENPLTKLIKEVVIKGGEDFCKKFEENFHPDSIDMFFTGRSTKAQPKEGPLREPQATGGGPD